MNEPIFIARQDTLEQEILPAHWLAQYKLFGEESYTFQDKGIWKKLCMSSAAANDRDIHAEALEEMLTTFSAEHTGKWMLLVYGMDAAALEGLATMAAIAANGTAMGAIVDNALLMHAIANSETAMQRIANSQTAMQRVANNRGAMDAIGRSRIARGAVQASPYYNSYIKENDMAIAKLVVGFANLESAGYSGMAGVAADSTAMTAVAASATAMTAVAASSVARNAISASPYYDEKIKENDMAIAKLVVGFANLASANYSSMTAVAASSTAMTAVAASATAMGKIAAVDAALSKLAASTTAMDALYARKKQMKGGSASKSGKFIILEISQSNAFNTSKYGYAILSDGSKPDWSSYLAKYAFFQKYPKYATYMLNDTDSDDYIYYFDIASP
nr:MAG TPA: Tail fiber protein [Caudoviricetes sp.]